MTFVYGWTGYFATNVSFLSYRYQLFKTFTAIPCCVAALGMLQRYRARAWNEDMLDETFDVGWNMFRVSIRDCHSSTGTRDYLRPPYLAVRLRTETVSTARCVSRALQRAASTKEGARYRASCLPGPQVPFKQHTGSLARRH